MTVARQRRIYPSVVLHEVAGVSGAEEYNAPPPPQLWV